MGKIYHLTKKLMGESNNVVRYKDIIIDVLAKIVFINSKMIYFPRLEFLVLLFLIKNPHQVVSRLDLLESVWGYSNACMATNTVDSHIYNIRKRIPSDSIAKIITIPKVGFAIR